MATGYYTVIKGKERTHKRWLDKNEVVYALLADATIEGSAHWLIYKYEDEMDGRGAWKELTDWYDGQSVQTDVATGLRTKMKNTVLVPGMEINKFANVFMKAYNELKRIPGQAMSEEEAKNLFLENVQDPDYKNTVEFLRSNLDDRTLRELIKELRRKSMEMARTKESIKRVRRFQLLGDFLEDQSGNTHRPK